MSSPLVPDVEDAPRFRSRIIPDLLNTRWVPAGFAELAFRSLSIFHMRKAAGGVYVDITEHESGSWRRRTSPTSTTTS